MLKKREDLYRKKLKELKAQLRQVENYSTTVNFEEIWKSNRIVELIKEIENVKRLPKH